MELRGREPNSFRKQGSRTEDAEYWIRRAVALAPDDAHAHKHLGKWTLGNKSGNDLLYRSIFLDYRPIVAGTRST